MFGELFSLLDADARHVSQITFPLAFPARKLQGVAGTASGTYHLTALVEHDGPPGDANHGHYFCHVQRDSSWLRCSDADIVQVGICTPCPRMHACLHT
jgi:hypothetical protein